MIRKEIKRLIDSFSKRMHKAAAELNFEMAAELRDTIVELRKQLADIDGGLHSEG